MPAVSRSFSAPDDLLKKADARQKSLGRENFSDYIKSLIRDDLHRAVAAEPLAMPRRESEIKIRVTDQMKRSVAELADSRQEAESVIVREAIIYYLKNAPPAQLEERARRQ